MSEASNQLSPHSMSAAMAHAQSFTEAISATIKCTREIISAEALGRCCKAMQDKQLCRTLSPSGACCGDFGCDTHHPLFEARAAARQQLGSGHLQMYRGIQALPRWQLHGGTDFVFFDPHPGFASGNYSGVWLEAWCKQLHQAIQLVPDSFTRHYCSNLGSTMPSQLLPVPYVRPRCLGKGLEQMSSMHSWLSTDSVQVVC